MAKCSKEIPEGRGWEWPEDYHRTSQSEGAPLFFLNHRLLSFTVSSRSALLSLAYPCIWTSVKKKKSYSISMLPRTWGNKTKQNKYAIHLGSEVHRRLSIANVSGFSWQLSPNGTLLDTVMNLRGWISWNVVWMHITKWHSSKQAYTYLIIKPISLCITFL